jgi:hypothetical protein
MAGDGKDEAWEEHSQRNDDSSGKCITQPTVDEATLESDKSCENDQWCGQNITNGNTINEDMLAQPSSFQDGLDLDKWYGCICATEGQTPSDQPEDKEIDE